MLRFAVHSFLRKRLNPVYRNAEMSRFVVHSFLRKRLNPVCRNAEMLRFVVHSFLWKRLNPVYRNAEMLRFVVHSFLRKRLNLPSFSLIWIDLIILLIYHLTQLCSKLIYILFSNCRDENIIIIVVIFKILFELSNDITFHIFV